MKKNVSSDSRKNSSNSIDVNGYHSDNIFKSEFDIIQKKLDESN